MTDLVFFYGTLMSGFKRPGRSRIDPKLTPVGRGSIKATLFDLGIYPAAIPASDERVLGEVHRMSDVDGVLAALDEIEGYRPASPTRASTRASKRRSPSRTAAWSRRGPTSTTRRSAARSGSSPATTSNISR